MIEMSKTEFKAHALEVFRNVEQSGQTLIITDRGMPKIEIRKIRRQEVSPMELLKNSVVKYESATAPVAADDWENA
ncbi:MAG: type II toxin-antitoxin system Phd/YefM family antitoxin [Colwellia sp.]|nr:type II toxin-antitoxin system Phd/YefM family antitoxin [Colwellia sp.]